MTLDPGSNERTPRIAHVSQPTSAGVANVALELVRDQVSRGWDAHLVCPNDGELSLRGRALGATVHDWHATRNPGLSVWGEARRLGRVIREIQPDVVLLHSSKAGLAGRLAMRGTVPTAFMPHSWSFEAVDGALRVASAAWERLGSRWADLTICVSEAEESLGKTKECLAARTLVVPNGVDLDRWAPRDRHDARVALGIAPDSRLAVCVGRLARQKGQDVLLDAWGGVTRLVGGAELVLVGDGPAEGDLRDRSRGMSNVRLVGRADPTLWFAAADVVVLPSRWEGMPLVALEAMASGRCVVGTDVSGMREAIGDASCVVPVADASALAGALVRRLSYCDLRRAEGLRNRSRAEMVFSVQRSSEAVALGLLSLVRPL